MAELPRRPNYFQSQFLVVRDFEDEQAYHEGMLRRHNLLLHEWGVVRDGLQVTKTPDNQNLSISPGSAIDSLGREIVLESTRLLSLDRVREAARASATGQDVSVTISFLEIDSDRPEDKYPPPNGTVNATRKMQSPVIEATKTPPTDGTVIILARVSVSGDDVGQPDNAVRRLASSFIAPLDGALSFTAKNSPIPQVGLDYDAASDALRIKARTREAPTLDATHLTIKRETGNVGIGMTPDPEVKLDVAGGIRIHSHHKINISDNNHALRYGAGTFLLAGEKIDGPVLYGYSGGALGSHQGDKATEQKVALRWTADGNVGIGTTSPTAPLHIISRFAKTDTTARDVATFSSNEATNPLGLKIRIKGDTDANAANRYVTLQVEDGSEKRPLILQADGGNVGIGTTKPQHLLSIGDGIGFDPSDRSPNAGYIRFGDNSGWKLHIGRSKDGPGWGNNTSTAGVLMTIQDNGNVGIGTTNPGSTLDVVGDAKVSGKINIGDWTISSDGDYLQFSRGSSIVARFSVGQDRIQVYQNLDAKAPYFFYNKNGISSTFNG